MKNEKVKWEASRFFRDIIALHNLLTFKFSILIFPISGSSGLGCFSFSLPPST